MSDDAPDLAGNRLAGKGRFTITRTTSNARPDYITVWVEAAGLEIRGELELADFAAAVTGRSFVTLTACDVRNVGERRTGQGPSPVVVDWGTTGAAEAVRNIEKAHDAVAAFRRAQPLDDADAVAIPDPEAVLARLAKLSLTDRRAMFEELDLIGADVPLDGFVDDGPALALAIGRAVHLGRLTDIPRALSRRGV
jgi:hypothetical protein